METIEVSSTAQLLHEALLSTLGYHARRAPAGLIFSGLAAPAEWLPQLLGSLAADSEQRYYVSVVGASSALEAQLPIPDGLRFGLGATHAVAVRNDLDLPANARRVVLVLRPEARLKSLRNYRALYPTDVALTLARRGVERARSRPQPQQQLWESLAKGQPMVELAALLNYFSMVFGPDQVDARDALACLNLLPDPELFNGSSPAIAQRLRDNARLTQQLLLQDQDDLNKAYGICAGRSKTPLSPALAESLQLAYSTFYELDPAQPLATQFQPSLLDPPTITFELARLLLGQQLLPPYQAGAGTEVVAGGDEGEPAAPVAGGDEEEVDEDDDDQEGHQPPFITPDDQLLGADLDAPSSVTGGLSGLPSGSTGGSTKKQRYYFGLDDAAVSMAAADPAGKWWPKEVKSLLRTLEKMLAKEPEKDAPLNGSTTEVEHAVDTVAQALTQTLLSPAMVGGILAWPAASTVDEALALLTAEGMPEPESVRGEAWLDKLRSNLVIAGNLVPGFRGEALFDEFLALRATFWPDMAPDTRATSTADSLPLAELLTAAPLATMLVNETARTTAHALVLAYEAVLNEVATHFAALENKLAGAKIAALLLRLDLVEVRAGGANRAALLAPLHPLVLWKHLELVKQVLAGKADQLRIVLDRPDGILEPLQAIVLAADPPYPPVPLAQSGWVGTWPAYRPTGLVQALVGPKLLAEAARKLLVLYPPVRRQLRILVYHPIELRQVAEALRKLVLPADGQLGFDKLHLLLALRPDGPRPNLQALDPLLQEGQLTIETRVVAQASDVAAWLVKQPVHLLVVSGQRDLHPLHINRDHTHLHPLSLPRTLEYDQLESELLLQPRGQQPDAEASASPGSQPFAPFHTLAAQLSGQPGREWSGRLTRRAADGTQEALLPTTVFLLLSSTAPAAGPLILARRGGNEGDAVVTHWKQRFVHGVRSMLSKLNYQPTDQGIERLLQRLEAVGQAGLFHTISAKVGGFSQKELKGQLAVAVALRWYEEEAAANFHLTIGCDSDLAARWLMERDTRQRPDLLGLRRDPQDGSLVLDVIEVKSYDVGVALDVPDGPGPQLRAGAEALLPIVNGEGGDMFTDCRRERLREQIFREGQLADRQCTPAPVWAAWVEQVSQALDGKIPVKLNLLLVEVLADQNFDVRRSQEPALNATSPNLQDRLPINRIKLGELRLSAFLRDEPPAPPVAAFSPAGPPTPPAAPAVGGPTGPEPIEAGNADSVSTDVTTKQPNLTTATDNSVMPPVVAVTTEGPSTPVISHPAVATPPPSGSAAAVERPSLAELQKLAFVLYRGLQTFDLAPARAIDPALADVGPSIIRFRVLPPDGQRITDVQNRARDLQRILKLTKPPGIDLLPGTDYLRVDVPRSSPEAVPLLPVLAAEASAIHPPLYFPVGMSPDGEVHWLSLPKLPHLLVGGTTNSGKTIFLYSLLVALTQRHPAAELQLLLIDPKQTDFGFFAGLPHLYGGQVVEEPEDAVVALQALAATEFPRRTALLKQTGCRDIQEYHQLGQSPEPLPYIVVVIDEFADLLDSLSKNERRDFEQLIGRFAQRSRSVGIHLVIATQRPDSKVIFGNLKNNLIWRIAFRLDSGVSSRVVLDRNGAEDLLGNGDLLLKTPSGIQRLQGLFISSNELRDLYR